MQCCKKIIFNSIVFLFFIIPARTLAQDKQNLVDSIVQGDIYGLVKDTVQNFYFQAASVAVYQGNGRKLVSYSLTNSIGEFHLKKLPLNKKLFLSVSYVGYQPIEVQFNITPETSTLNLGTIYLNKDSSATLDEVVVTNSPVRMHGDTLEFSAGAFALEKNAVAEDLLKVLPGIIVWGDGLITINGRPINKLLVDGKPFFGGDTKIALQNIPKTSIEKVQVYQESINPYNPFDSLTSINLKLRKDHQAGYFGVLSEGIGTNSRNESTIANSFFNQLNQFTIVAQTNNTNKLTNDISGVLINTTYKGNSLKLDYQPDFLMFGANMQKSGGIGFTHDFIPVYNENKKNRLDIQSFINQTTNTTARQSYTTTTIGPDSTIFQTGDNFLNTLNTIYRLEGRYIKKNQWDSMAIATSFIGNNMTQRQNWQNTTLNEKPQLLNFSAVSDSLGLNSYSGRFTATHNHHGFFNSETHHLTDWSVLYDLVVTGNSVNKNRSALINSATAPSQNATYNRLFNNTESNIHNNLSFSLGNFAVAIFHRNRFLSRFNMQLSNKLEFDFRYNNDVIGDVNPLTGITTKNLFLTRNSKLFTLFTEPGISVSRNFYNILANRYQKDVILNILIKEGIYSEMFTNRTNMNKKKYQYAFFTPKMSLLFSNNQYGEYLNQFTTSFSSEVLYPKFAQRNLLADSSESYSILFGNPDLQPERKYILSMSFSHNSFRSKTPISYGFGVKYGWVGNYIGDSMVIDNAGKYFIFPVNFPKSKIVEASFYVRDAIINGKDQLQISFKSDFKALSVPGIVGYQSVAFSNSTYSSLYIHTDSLAIHYTFGNLGALNLKENIGYYHSKQLGIINGGYNNLHLQTIFGAGINFSDFCNISSNVSFNSYPRLNVSPNRFIIWNASFALKFLRSKTLEMKISALDILRQNRGIYFLGNNNSFTQGTVNLLQQYYMFSLSYYPRKFQKSSLRK